jgi:zinc D-Ala-D-Ala carboxypeptidase
MLSTLPAGGISSAYRKLLTCWQHRAALTGGMSYSEPARTTGGRTRATILAAALVVATAALIGVLGCPSLAASSLSATSPEPIALRPHDSPRRDHQSVPDEADVVVPDGTTAFDDDIPAVANLDPKLLRALRRAATSAAGDGVEFYVISGWRSRKHQEQLFREAVSKYGSKEEAARWVATPGTSAHETGNAVDIGHSDATAWLAKHGAKYGLCQIYSNEPWHYELRPDAVDHSCPPPYADATQDPRTHRYAAVPTRTPPTMPRR